MQGLQPAHTPTCVASIKKDTVAKHRDGEVTVYYRDHEQPFELNVDQSDNVLNLPRYLSS